MSNAGRESPELEKNKQLVHNFIEDTLNRHDIGAADKYLTSQNPIRYNQQVMGTEGFKEPISARSPLGPLIIRVLIPQ